MSHPYSTALTRELVCTLAIVLTMFMMPVQFATKVSTLIIMYMLHPDHINSISTLNYIGLHNYTDGRLRLSDSTTTGRLDLSVGGDWGTVCDNNWNLDDATVACHQLGYNGAWTAYYQPGEGLVKVEEPQCTGEEPTLLDCWTAQSNEGNAFCSHGRDVAVDCMTSTSYGMPDA